MEENKKELTLIRYFDADRETVWNYWTDAKLIQQWWGPQGVTNPTCVWEAVPQGKINIVMLAGEELGPLAGQKWPMSGMFDQLQKPEKLVFVSSAIMNEKPILDTRVTVNFEEEGEKTKMTVHIVVTKTTPEAEGPLSGMEMGWNQQLDKLVAFVR